MSDNPEFKTCPICDGTRVLFDGQMEITCPKCDGEGEVEVDFRICPECQKEVDRNEMAMTKDRYGIPYKLVCYDCYDKVDEEIKEWEYDPSYAGESLEEDY